MTDGHRQEVHGTQVDGTAQVDRQEVHGTQVDGTAQVDRQEVHGTQVDRKTAQVDRQEVDRSTQVDRKTAQVDRTQVDRQEVDSTQNSEASLNAEPTARSRRGAFGPPSVLLGVSTGTRVTLPGRQLRTLP
ncbi:MAG: hypothetical protein M3O88_06615 [Actinomycetota bacterium]|nr:hypothetical protein [Actinomycetota bacterium]